MRLEGIHLVVSISSHLFPLSSFFMNQQVCLLLRQPRVPFAPARIHRDLFPHCSARVGTTPYLYLCSDLSFPTFPSPKSKNLIPTVCSAASELFRTTFHGPFPPLE